MIDPTVNDLVTSFVHKMNEINELWSELQSHDVYVRVEDEKSPKTDTKRFVIKEIKQSVAYFTPEKNNDY